MSVLDYIGRTADVVAFHGVGVNSSQETEQALIASDGSALVTGILKLAQKFILLLLTPVGSQRYFPDRGTAFILEAQAGVWRNAVDVEQSFIAAVTEIRRQLINESSPDDPLDEVFGSVNLISITLAGTDVSIRVKITSAAGSSRELIVPINTTI